MARALFFALLAMCLVCLMECGPVPDQAGEQPSPIADLKEAGEKLAASVKAEFDKLMNDPTLVKISEDASKLVLEAVDQAQKTAHEYIQPKP